MPLLYQNKVIELMVKHLVFVVLQVAMVARTKWLEVGQYLGLKMSDLEEYEEREPKSLHYRLFRLLVDWKRKVENPTVGDVVLACQKAGVGGDVKRALQAP